MQLRLEAIKVLLATCWYVQKHNYIHKYIYPINYVGKDYLFKLGETHMFKILVDKLSSDPIQVVICYLNIIDIAVRLCDTYSSSNYCNSCVVVT